MDKKPDALMPVAHPAAPNFALPEGACDAHVHLVAGAHEYPLWKDRVENPAPGHDLDGWIDLFDTHLTTLGMSRTVVVHSILYGTDNSVTIEAVRRLGDRACGVGLLPDGASESEIDGLADANIKAVRLNYVHGGVLTWDGAKAMAPALAARNMHIQMLAHADRHMSDLAEDVRALPCPAVFDHCGWPTNATDTDNAGFQALSGLLSEGHSWVKLSGIYRFTDDHDQAGEVVAALVKANPDRCLWGSDWPHLMLADATQPNAGDLLNAFGNVVTDDATRKKILVENPVKLFGF